MKKQTKPKILFALFIAILLLPIISPIVAFAESDTNVSTVEKISQSTVKKVNDTSKIDGSEYIPNTTMGDANRWVSDKGDDLVGLGATIAQPISVLGFILGLFITLIGAFSRSSHLSKGLLVMAISIVVYVGAVFAPEIVFYFSNWLSS